MFLVIKANCFAVITVLLSVITVLRSCYAMLRSCFRVVSLCYRVVPRCCRVVILQCFTVLSRSLAIASNNCYRKGLQIYVYKYSLGLESSITYQSVNLSKIIYVISHFKPISPIAHWAHQQSCYWALVVGHANG